MKPVLDTFAFQLNILVTEYKQQGQKGQNCGVLRTDQMLCNLKIEIFDPICMQLIYENIFERLVKEELDKDCTSS